jgi:hypothetical protein
MNIRFRAIRIDVLLLGKSTREAANCDPTQSTGASTNSRIFPLALTCVHMSMLLASVVLQHQALKVGFHIATSQTISRRKIE